MALWTPNGNLFIADSYNNRIRKVDANGIITTVAGISTSGFSAGMAAQLLMPYFVSAYGVAVDGGG